MKKKLLQSMGFVSGILCALTILLIAGPSLHAQAAVTVALDPGHGGPALTSDNQGAQYAPYSEKNITLDLATRIKAELETYDGINVVMTRTGDNSTTLAERAQIAKNAGASFLFSIHYNASSSHLYYGSEVWTSAFGANYAQGAAFGQLELSELTKLGYYSKGVKTRIGTHGDYYGIIRESTARGIPAVIIEHCYLDNNNDRALLGNSTAALAHADATAIAEYYHLRKKDGSVDFSHLATPVVANAPATGIPQDLTAPDICHLEVVANDGNGNITLRLTAKDTDSSYPILYYSYVVNGIGTALIPFPAGQNSVNFSVKVPVGQTSAISAAAYNSYELSTASETVNVK